MSRLVVVSNRVAKPGNKLVQGGLAVALVSALERSGGVWFGWSGEIRQATDERPDLKTHGNVTYATAPITRKGYQEYYAGYANGSLWPLFHCQLHEFTYERQWQEGYYRVNRMFARKLLTLLKEDDVIWVHDYHFIPLCKLLREAGVRSSIGFFLHIPFPPYEVLRALPDHEALLQNLCEYDLVGFQTQADVNTFTGAVQAMQKPGRGKERMKKGSRLTAWGRQIRTGAFPIGIDVDEVVRMAEQGRRSNQTRRLKSRLVDSRDLIIGIDRLDYSKGLQERMRAYERLLKCYPSNRCKVEYLQIAAPSRSDVPQYVEIQRELNYLAGQINSEYSEYDWIPLHYLNKAFARSTIMGFLSISRVGLVTPIRDGMNLVAKEFVASQDPQDPGVLVLSCLAGAASELTEALIVNPYDIDGIAGALETALTMSLPQRNDRWQSMMRVLSGNDVFRWVDLYLANLMDHGGEIREASNA